MFSSAIRLLSNTSRNVFKRHLSTSPIVQRTILPAVIEEMGNDTKVYDLYTRLLKERIVCLLGTIDLDSANSIVAQLIFLNSENPRKPIQMYINSGGGSVTDGLAIYDTMQYVSPPITTFCIGQACSMAAVLLAAGEPGHRFALPNARIMIHQPLGQAAGQATDIEIISNEILRMKKQLHTILANHTGQLYDDVLKATERDNFMTPQDAKSFGIIDSILEKQEKPFKKKVLP